LAFLAFFEFFGLFGQFWLFLANLVFFAFLDFEFHVAYIYRVQKLDLDDSVEGTEKAM
jgi:hypothetical protein